MITIPKTPSPDILYKYYPPERIDALENLEVHFTSPSRFNDAFDSYHLLPAASGSKLKAGQLRLRTEMGVFCLTERPDNHIMWVNYAKSHTGFVLGFDAAESFFFEDGRELRKVVYQETPPIFDQANENGCFYKSPDWSYEHEWRCVRRFERMEKRSVSINWTMIKEIIFGHQTAGWFISRMVQFASLLSSDGDPMPRLFKSSPAHSKWRFENKERQFATCDCCNGQGYIDLEKSTS